MHRLQHLSHAGFRSRTVAECRRAPVVHVPLHEEKIRRRLPVDSDLPYVPPGALERLKRRQGRLPEHEMPQPTLQIDDGAYDAWRRKKEQPQESDRGVVIIQL